MVFDVKFLISAVSGLLLVLVVGALIFNPGFRKDLIASEGSASLFGVISVEGVMVLILCALFVFGMIYPITKDANASETQDLDRQVKALDTDNQELNTRIEDFEAKHLDLSEQVETLESVNSTLEKANIKLENEKQALTTKYNALTRENEGQVSKNAIASFITELDIEDDLSESLRQIQMNKKGPWSPASGTYEVVISVPGGYPPGKNYSCQKYHRKRVELITDYKRGNRGHSRHEVKIKGLIAHTHQCREIYKIDFQLSCADAQKLYSSDVLECDAQNNPLWKEGVTHKLPARATILQDDARYYNTERSEHLATSVNH